MEGCMLYMCLPWASVAMLSLALNLQVPKHGALAVKRAANEKLAASFNTQSCREADFGPPLSAIS